ncbi:hypothetical protein HMPREF0083_02080 [Aneurinibacillus aneurinilyticus ATCC 12856]|uniref:Uncharacterized protein n=1 Tax=Aneurinibacillus aneurinilyticus ATCC 12856 TaxID=649747 RepID=U1YCK8_ANEAE|nr:hypothetical protein HMPREF0083_02080 [Aneurinibacillus aneurinilyticus ATCC 12856]
MLRYLAEDTEMGEHNVQFPSTTRVVGVFIFFACMLSYLSG